MSVFVASLNSGSNGNCYYIGNSKDAVLVDAGISCRETERRMKRLGLPINNVRAIYISHEHHDHIKGVQVLSARYNIPVYITKKTLANSKLALRPVLIHEFEHGVPVLHNELTITGFSKEHDAIHPHSFIISCGGVTVGVFTDLGIACDNLITYFSRCHAAFLEANYDEVMLEQGRYPVHLKNRIRGGKGHLSNKQALELFQQHRPAHMSHLFLSHLSKENNHPELALELFQPHAQGIHVSIASRYKESELFHIKAADAMAEAEFYGAKQAVMF
jgi:phosphoribosyl 1,2-cyclic phosphodiesterase